MRNYKYTLIKGKKENLNKEIGDLRYRTKYKL